MSSAPLADARLWPRFKELLDEALEREGDERARFLATLERGEPELARELARWIALEPRARGFLEDSPRSSSSHRIAFEPGARIGRYEITAVLGSGGSAVVFEARQRDPERKLALKVFQGSAVDGNALRRFRGEAELLARLCHPSIAQVYETASVADEHGARPFIAMELVEGGVELTRAARESALDLGRRLALFLELCDAVAHAHEHGVVHRDLKPHNVLVDGAGRVKVIDFGVARLQAEEPRLTAPGELLGTPAYMSPEQLAGDPSAVSTRSDVYSLGVILRELCAERPDEERAKPLPRDLEAIERTARAEAPARRYATAHELAADLRRFLASEPVLARPPSFAHQLALLARRHRSPVLALAAGAFLFAGTLAFASWRVARVQSAERAKAELVTEFLASLLESGRPSAGGPAEFGLIDPLDEADRRLDTELADAPEARAELRATLGIAYRELGEYERAVLELRLALDARSEAGGDEGAERAAWLNCLGDVLASADRHEEAEAVLREAIELEARDADAPRIYRGITAHDLSRALLGLGRFGEARAEADLARAIYAEELGPDHEAIGGVERTLGEIARAAGETELAASHHRAALAVAAAAHGADSLQAAQARLDLARARLAAGAREEALALLESARGRLVASLPAGHPRLALLERLAGEARDR